MAVYRQIASSIYIYIYIYVYTHIYIYIYLPGGIDGGVYVRGHPNKGAVFGSTMSGVVWGAVAYTGSSFYWVPVEELQLSYHHGYICM